MDASPGPVTCTCSIPPSITPDDGDTSAHDGLDVTSQRSRPLDGTAARPTCAPSSGVTVTSIGDTASTAGVLEGVSPSHATTATAISAATHMPRRIGFTLDLSGVRIGPGRGAERIGSIHLAPNAPNVQAPLRIRATDGGRARRRPPLLRPPTPPTTLHG
jgi:hypothetical protein